MTQENCLFSFKDPCAIQMATDVRGDLNQSWFWYETQRAQCITCSDFFAPLVVFIDSTPVDMYGKVNVEPIMFTGGWFKREVCTKAQSWRPLGFVADIKVKSSAQNATGKFATKDYHAVLKVILQNVAAVHSAGGFHHTLCLNGRYFDVKVKCPIAVIIGDAKGNNSLCAHFNSSRSKQLCRECDTMFDETDNPYSLCHCVTQQRVQDMVMGGERKGIEGLSFHNIENAFWNISLVPMVMVSPALPFRNFVFHQGRYFKMYSQRIGGSAKW